MEKHSMVVYSVQLPDSKILSRVAGLKSVVILGCSACANMNIAHDKNLPVSRVVVDKDTEDTLLLPVAIMEEANRLKDLLESNGVLVRIEMWGALCVLPTDNIQQAELDLISRCAEAEAVIVLACPVGAIGVKRRLGRGVKVISSMKTVGLSLDYTVFDETREFIYIDKKKSRIIPMLKE